MDNLLTALTQTAYNIGFGASRLRAHSAFKSQGNIVGLRD